MTASQSRLQPHPTIVRPSVRPSIHPTCRELLRLEKARELLKEWTWALEGEVEFAEWRQQVGRVIQEEDSGDKGQEGTRWGPGGGGATPKQ